MHANLFNLSGRTALITGSARGIGYAIAEALSQAGARVILNSRTPEALMAAAAQLRGTGRAVEICPFDVCDPDAVEAAVERIEGTIGAIDILVNNAGIQRRASLERFTNKDWRELMATNLDSVYYVSKAVAVHMIGRRRGKIINIGSVQCELARPGIAPDIPPRRVDQEPHQGHVR